MLRAANSKNCMCASKVIVLLEQNLLAVDISSYQRWLTLKQGSRSKQASCQAKRAHSCDQRIQCRHSNVYELSDLCSQLLHDGFKRTLQHSQLKRQMRIYGSPAVRLHPMLRAFRTERAMCNSSLFPISCTTASSRPSSTHSSQGRSLSIGALQRRLITSHNSLATLQCTYSNLQLDGQSDRQPFLLRWLLPEHVISAVHC